ncbi:HEPN domain-containing protein [Halococcus hamelinensis]|uniref:Putative toxin-antitoxin system, antitoxin component n=1 Tax=Halococcus hamelinensis 100A6 TaxID=1132509 RepID=M0LTL8_9EURY|nr:HEPN domain-containing protein [Halococcus hamelinensis]EMA36902.1 putative toxin-antitoxin system, antitoxin component [Halococcus hamelinensis 100A6]
MVDDDRDAAVDREIQQAQQALDDAAKAQDAELSDAAVINRLYYAAFHSVQAVLYAREFDPSSHGGVLSLFGSEVIAVGDASRDDGRFFSQLSELRQQADYGYDELDENVGALYSRTQKLVTKMESLCTPAE